MRTIGIIGGISWLSTVDYYRIINEKINQRLGGTNAAKLILYSVNYEEIKVLTFANDWPAMVKMLSDIAIKLEAAGADCLLLGANTMHKIAGEIQESISIPLIHIADETAKAVQAKKIKKVALLGTKYTMELDFYPSRFAAPGIELLIPGEEDRQYIHNAIYEEMGKGLFLAATRKRVLAMIDQLSLRGAEGVIFGCTELPLLVEQDDCALPIFNTTLIHAEAAVDFALK